MDCYAATPHTGSVLSPHPAHHRPDDSPPSHTHTHTHTNHTVLHASACETKAGLVRPGPALVQEA